MKYRQIPKTEIELSEIGFGCGGNAGLMVRGTAREQTDIIARALDLGITYFDNSPDYGDCIAEINLGRALREVGVRPILNSKVEIRRENLGDIADHVVRSAEQSMQRLGVDYLDVFQIHNGPITPPPQLEGATYFQLSTDDFLRAEGAMDGLERLLSAGKIRATGFICRGDDRDDVMRLIETGAFNIINIPYTLLNPTAGIDAPPGLSAKPDFGNIITAAYARDVACAVYSPLAGGYLTDGALNDTQHQLARPKDFKAASAQSIMARVRSLRTIFNDPAETLAQAAIRFVLSHPGVTTALGGFSAVEQLEDAASVPDRPPYSADLLTRLERLWASDFDDTDS